VGSKNKEKWRRTINRSREIGVGPMSRKRKLMEKIKEKGWKVR